MAGLKTVILLSFVLAFGFLSLILSCALWNNWLPILVALIFFLAPFPNALASACTRSSDFSAEYDNTSPIIDFGRFTTSIMVATGFALPIVLAHSQIIHPWASFMSIFGGALVYGTIMAYAAVFKQDNDEF
ncbi:vacuolar protein sorting 55 [Cantharellus anzutake]|uniref:vacuolar protein sorting 55 n=1 Tax=Cantharellus anzutake TaxID=1750568 RepID=UPI00190512B8|nr:vacuolar protein sorting 55 [Cantharellus anzutake]KAF8334315.1 vacuolar protein sorting 55 [Cantharellus anzutake]